MKVFLMYPERDFDREAPLPRYADDLIQDLELETIINAMGPEDEFLQSVARAALLAPLTNPETIVYRQKIMADCQRNADTVTEIYDIAVDAIEQERRSMHFGRNRASTLVRQSIDVLGMFAEHLKKLRAIADQRATDFQSPGFKRLFATLQESLDDSYLETIDHHLKELKFEHGVLVSASLGPGNKGQALVLRELPESRRGRFAWLFHQQPTTRGFEVAPRDQAGSRALDELRNRGLNAAANAVGQSADHVLAFFRLLKTELAFYLGSLNLHRALEVNNAETCFPTAGAVDQRRHSARGLYDICLRLTTNEAVVSNDLDADDTPLIFVTGANRGGKSTFLRSIGTAQLMMQSGLFVAAQSFSANVCSGIFTHFRREEDSAMKSGKFDEELVRMSEIVDDVSRDGLVLFNESFSATNEREGSDIAGQIVDVLLDKHIQVVFVTHFYELASAFHEPDRAGRLFLRAERSPDGGRTFKLTPGDPSPTSHGQDLYERIFSTSTDSAAADDRRQSSG